MGVALNILEPITHKYQRHDETRLLYVNVKFDEQIYGIDEANARIERKQKDTRHYLTKRSGVSLAKMVIKTNKRHVWCPKDTLI